MFGFLLYEVTELTVYTCKIFYNIASGTYSYFFSDKQKEYNELTLEQLRDKLDEMDVDMELLREIIKNKCEFE